LVAPAGYIANTIDLANCYKGSPPNHNEKLTTAMREQLYENIHHTTQIPVLQEILATLAFSTSLEYWLPPHQKLELGTICADSYMLSNSEKSGPVVQVKDIYINRCNQSRGRQKTFRSNEEETNLSKEV